MQTDTIIRRIEVPGAGSRAVRVRAGELVRVVDVDGGQVGDVFAPGRHARPPVFACRLTLTVGDPAWRLA
jgi:hypothetical protein